MRTIMNYIRHSKGFFWLFILYIALFLADLGSTLMIYRYLEHLEVNPVYKWIGIPGIFIINLVIIVFLWYYYPKAGTINRYLFINAMVSVIYLRIIAIRNAFYWYNLQPEIEQVGTSINNFNFLDERPLPDLPKFPRIDNSV